MIIRAAILTLSDRSARGERADLSGPAIAAMLTADRFSIVRQSVLADDAPLLRDVLAGIADRREADLILTTGGTGFAPRDSAPEATRAVIEREAPGFGEAMRAASRESTKHWMLSRGIAGIRGSTIIVNLPGSPAGAAECLAAILPALPHAVDLLRSDPAADRHA